MNSLNVLTGGPGSGKTSVIEILCNRNYKCAEEVGREIIKSQKENGGQALPWGDEIAFRDEMILKETKAYDYYKDSKQVVFFDRGIVDVYGYSKLESLDISDELVSKCHNFRYSPNVFIFPPWEEIYANDIERKQNFREAVDTYEKMIDAYTYFKYSLIDVPKVSVIDRVEFILESMSND